MISVGAVCVYAARYRACASPTASTEELLFHGFATNLFPAPLPGKHLLNSFLFARFQVEGVLFNFLNNVFLLDLSFETPQSVFNRFAVLNPNFRQSLHPQSGCDRPSIITYFGGYGDVSIVFGAGRKAILSGKGCKDLHRMLWNETRS